MDPVRKKLRGLVEAILFVSPEPLKVSHLAKLLSQEKTLVRDILDELVLDYDEKDGGFKLREVAGGYQFYTNEIFHEELGKVFQEKKKETLSRGNLDVLAIIAYKQPITLGEIDEIRGVSSRAVLTSLLSRKLIKPVGQKEVPGRPTLYGTSNEFLIHFGLARLSDLPTPVEVKELKFEEIPLPNEIEEAMNQEPNQPSILRESGTIEEIQVEKMIDIDLIDDELFEEEIILLEDSLSENDKKFLDHL
jgi:segregation and condensation protein B